MMKGFGLKGQTACKVEFHILKGYQSTLVLFSILCACCCFN